MEGSTVVLIATGVVVALGALFVFTTSARRDRQAALRGVREAERADKGSEAVERLKEEDGAPVSGRDVEREAVLAWRGGKAVVVAPSGAPPAPRAPMDPEALGVTRRQFFNRGIVGFFTLGLTGFGAASVGFLWPTLSGGFGAKIKVGKLDDILQQVQ